MKVINVHDPNLGIGSVVELPQPGVASVRFSNRAERISYSLKSGVLQRTYLRATDTCKRVGEEGTRTVRAIRLVEDEDANFRSYEYLSSDGRNFLLREDEVVVVQGGFSPDLMENLANLRGGKPGRFYARLEFLKVVERTHAEARGLVSLIGSRLKPYPHQAFVAGTVLRDYRRRYMLADEVGLGKTIEAGLIVQNLLLTGNASRVLIVAPGTIAQQWLCEMYIKFGRTVFRFLSAERLRALKGAWVDEDLVICPTYLLEQSANLRRQLAVSDWDVIVIDEVHRLVADQGLYESLNRVARDVPTLLLLSATPVEGRHADFLRLLQLLDPPLFGDLTLEEFASRLDLQSKISDLLISTEADPSDHWTFNQWQKTLPDDETVARLAEESKSDPNQAARLCRYVEDYYRIHRRILRNRRDSGFVTFPERAVEVYELEPSVAEKSLYTELELLFAGYTADVSEDLLRWSYLLCLASCASPRILAIFLRGRLESFTMDDPVGVTVNLEGIQEKALRFSWGETVAEKEQLQRCLEKARALEQGDREDKQARYRWLLEFLEAHENQNPLPKFLLFTHFPLTADVLATALREEYGEDSIAEFHEGLSPDKKNSEAIRFAKDPLCTLMISDELGGEGRNFQFASGIIHYDLPWQVFQLEQRIGRLDRLGREAKVVSHVPVYRHWVDEGLAEIYKEGVRIFDESASGVEFIFGKVVRASVETALEGGSENMRQEIPRIRELVSGERARVSNQMFFDRSSYHPEEHREFQELRQLEISSVELEKSFSRWAKKLGAWVRPSERFLEVGTRDVTFPLAGSVRPDIHYRGTFDRDVAVRDESLEFFSVGHPLVASFIDAARSDFSSGSLFQRRLGGRVDWTGFRFLLAYGCDEDLLGDEGGSQLSYLAEVAFPRRVDEVFVRLADGELQTEDREEVMEYLQSEPQKGEHIEMITEEQLQARDLHAWANLCRSAEQAAYKTVAARYETQQKYALAEWREECERQILHLSVISETVGPPIDLDFEEAVRSQLLDVLANLSPRTLAVAYYEVS